MNKFIASSNKNTILYKFKIRYDVHSYMFYYIVLIILSLLYIASLVNVGLFIYLDIFYGVGWVMLGISIIFLYLLARFLSKFLFIYMYRHNLRLYASYALQVYMILRLKFGTFKKLLIDEKQKIILKVARILNKYGLVSEEVSGLQILNIQINKNNLIFYKTDSKVNDININDVLRPKIIYQLNQNKIKITINKEILFKNYIYKKNVYRISCEFYLMDSIFNMIKNINNKDFNYYLNIMQQIDKTWFITTNAKLVSIYLDVILKNLIESNFEHILYDYGQLNFYKEAFKEIKINLSDEEVVTWDLWSILYYLHNDINVKAMLKIVRENSYSDIKDTQEIILNNFFLQIKDGEILKKVKQIQFRHKKYLVKIDT
ncbi:hypothetical protein ACR82Z_01690 [Mycoplasma sp. 6243]|uniref:hypothetical protein n=1 Tax=Mycoplasma sp. 6243 TaxID=3440865 RepID=UPI003EC14C79